MKWSPLLIQCVVFVLFFEEMSTTNNVYGNTKVYRIVISINNHFLKAVQKGNGKTNSITENSLYDNRNIRKKQLLLNLFHFFLFPLLSILVSFFWSCTISIPLTISSFLIHIQTSISISIPQQLHKNKQRSENDPRTSFVPSAKSASMTTRTWKTVFLFPPHFTQFLFLDHSHKRKGFSVLYLQQAILKSFFSQGSYQISWEYPSIHSIPIFSLEKTIYKCSFEGCNQEYLTKQSLKDHELTHTQLPVIKCLFASCNQYF